MPLGNGNGPSPPDYSRELWATLCVRVSNVPGLNICISGDECEGRQDGTVELSTPSSVRVLDLVFSYTLEHLLFREQEAAQGMAWDSHQVQSIPQAECSVMSTWPGVGHAAWTG